VTIFVYFILCHLCNVPVSISVWECFLLNYEPSKFMVAYIKQSETQ